VHPADAVDDIGAIRASRAAAGTTAVVVTAVLGFAAASWVVAVRQMRGMDMGPATELGSFGSFIALWVPMMAAMMLPGAVPAVVERVRTRGRVLAAPWFVASYLAVWTLVGVAAYGLYRPHGTAAAAAVVIAAGLYELAPVTRWFRRRCRRGARSGLRYGLCCVGSSIGLMLILLALGVMSIGWMSVIALIVTTQKLLPARAALDVPLALAVVALGSWIAVAPGSVPGLMPPM
jgi:predicted metal-binding membrane protein